jgi:photosystem II oxygen-evolving enhancer protein 1
MRYRALLVAFLAFCLGVLTIFNVGVAQAAPADQLTYDEILGTGLANQCPQISEFTRGTIPIDPNKPLEVSDLCLEPQEYFVKEEPLNKREEAKYVQGKLLTRYTTSLEQIRGTILTDANGVLTLKEKDGMDFQAVTVQLPGGKRVPFLFTIKSLVAQTEPGFTSVNTSTDFVGKFKVPSYRGASFLDPKGRGLTTGYDSAVALPADADSKDLNRANVKTVDIAQGKISLRVTKVNGDSGEIAGVFDSEQPSSTDLGAEEPEDVRIRGIFYAKLQPQS